MAVSIETIVNVSITKGTRQVPLQSFGIPLILGPSNRIGVNVRKIYTDLAGMITDGFLTSDPEYIHASALLSQSVKVEKFLVGKLTTAVAQISTISVTSVVNSFAYVATINGTACTFTSDGTATGAEIQAGLIAAINASAQASVVTASAGGGTDVVVTSDEAGLGFSITVGTNLSVVTGTANNGVANDIAAVSAVDDQWYCLLITSKASADIRQAAVYIETVQKIFACASSDANILTSSTTDIASQLKAKNYVRTFLIYSATPSAGPDAAWVGRVLPTGVGAASWKFKTLVGIVADNLTSTQIANAQGKNCNVYVTVGGLDITTEGVVASGEYIDVTRILDWLPSTMEAAVYSILINSDKLPYTNKGIAGVENAVRKTLQEGIDNGSLASNPAPVVSVPDILDVSSADKASRTLNGVAFTATLAGAIHKVTINGFVSV
jgi:hypothetical protein